EVGERKADPRNHHRPRLDATVAVNAVLERLTLQDVFEVHLSASGAFTVDDDGPRLRFEIPGEQRWPCARSRVELVKVVVRGDVLPRVRPLGRAEPALDGGQPSAMRCRPLPGFADDRAPGDREGGADELAAIQIDRLAGDVRASNSA